MGNVIKFPKKYSSLETELLEMTFKTLSLSREFLEVAIIRNSFASRELLVVGELIELISNLTEDYKILIGENK